MARSPLLVLLAAAALAPARAIYFFITEGQQRCFIEEVPADTLVVGTYKNPDFIPFGDAGFTGTGVNLAVTDPAGGAVMRKGMDTSGKFAYTSQQGGEYQICFSTNSSRWFGQPKKFRFDLKLDVGEMGIDYAEVAKKEHLTELELEVRRLNDKMKDVMKEQNYQREREVSFRNTSESTNARVQWWSVFQTVVMVVSGVWQIMHLKAFFKQRKLA